MTNSIAQVYLCKEIFDENSEPTQNEIEEHAYRLGIDPVNELHLLCIAKQCLLEPLPSNWFPCYIEKENKYFYYNNQSKQSQWEHPLDEYYRQIVEKTRFAEDSSTGQDISLNIISDEDNLLDVMYHTKNNNYEKKSLTEKRTVRFKTPIEESLDLDYSDDNMKFLGPIKLNTPYTNTTTLLNLPQFSTNNGFETRGTGSRSGFSKYNILPSKDEPSKKIDLVENLKKINNDEPTMTVDYNIGKETLRKIDITLTESSDRSESTSSEIHTENLNSDYDLNDSKEKNNDNISIGINKRHEQINRSINDTKLVNENFNEFQFIETTQLYNVKKDDVVSDSGNSTAKDSKTIQSPTTNSYSVTKNKLAEITQRFPLNQSTSETKIKPTENDENIFNNKSNNNKSKFETVNNLNDDNQKLLDGAYITNIIESHCDLIKNQLENTIKTKENLFREEFNKKIDDVIHNQNENFQKLIDTRYDSQFIKNELELKTILKNMQEKTEKSLTEQFDKKYIQMTDEQMYAENLNKFQKDLENYAETFKNKIQSELNIISNEFKNEFYRSSEIVTDSWKQTLESYKNIEFEKLKEHFEKTTEDVKHYTDVEINQFNLEFKEKLKSMSNDKFNNATDQLDIALREEIILVKKRLCENYQHNFNNTNKMSKHIPPTILYNGSDGECISEFPTTADNMHKVNYNDIRKKIQHCSDELNDALNLVNEASSINKYTAGTVSSVSCQTENVMSHMKPNLKEYKYPESFNTSLLNNPYDINTKYANYWNQAKMSQDLYSNYLATYSQMINPLDILGQEELKVNAAEQNLCHLIETFNNNSKHLHVYKNTPNNTNIYTNKFTNIYQTLTPKQIAYDRTKHLREWLYKMDLKNKK